MEASCGYEEMERCAFLLKFVEVGLSPELVCLDVGSGRARTRKASQFTTCRL